MALGYGGCWCWCCPATRHTALILSRPRPRPRPRPDTHRALAVRVGSGSGLGSLLAFWFEEPAAGTAVLVLGRVRVWPEAVKVGGWALVARRWLVGAEFPTRRLACPSPSGVGTCVWGGGAPAVDLAAAAPRALGLDGLVIVFRSGGPVAVVWSFRLSRAKEPVLRVELLWWLVESEPRPRAVAGPWPRPDPDRGAPLSSRSLLGPETALVCEGWSICDALVGCWRDGKKDKEPQSWIILKKGWYL